MNKTKENLKPVKPDVSKFRRALFWDTTVEMIDWNKQKTAIIKRVFERGNFTEKKEVIQFYGTNAIREILSELKKK